MFVSVVSPRAHALKPRLSLISTEGTRFSGSLPVCRT
jgi:hypothetical protein